MVPLYRVIITTHLFQQVKQRHGGQVTKRAAGESPNRPSIAFVDSRGIGIINTGSTERTDDVLAKSELADHFAAHASAQCLIGWHVHVF